MKERAAARRAVATKAARPPARRAAKITCHPATRERWGDVELLFGERGACGGCWCMVWRVTRSQFEQQKGEGNRRALRGLVEANSVPGVLAYAGGEPIGWCAVAPREAYGTLDRSRVLAPVDGAPVWSISCLFVARPHRGRGVSVVLLEGAVAHARASGARIVEGYPVEPRKGKMPDAFAWTGIPSAFERAGFREVARRSDTRPIMRRSVRPPS